MNLIELLKMDAERNRTEISEIRRRPKGRSIDDPSVSELVKKAVSIAYEYAGENMDTEEMIDAFQELFSASLQDRKGDDGRMAITDELRKWSERYTMCKDMYDELTAIADRIDAEHENMLYSCDREFEEWKHTQDTCYIKLPVDADGEPIHVGDVVYCESTGTHFDVYSIELQDSDDSLRWAIRMFRRDGKGGAYTATDGKFMHHAKHTPTVEDVLREFAEKMTENLGMYTSEAIEADEWRAADKQTIAEYAAKLRLADDGKER